MNNNELPNLSTWHTVPTGATIPKGTPYAYIYGRSLNVRMDGHFADILPDGDGSSWYTEHPIAPPLPTEEGATIMVSGNKLPPHVLLTCVGGGWFDRYGDKWLFDDILVWAPVTLGEVVVMP